MSDDDDTSAAKTFDLSDAFLKRQEKLLSDLGVGDIATHPGTKGDATELNWLNMLADLLPRRYGVAKAFVIDSHGTRSEQIDVVIHDRHFSPLLFEIGGSKFIPAESVYATFEVKQHLDKPYLDCAAGKIASVRRLHRTSVPVPHAGGKYEPVTPKRIIGGVLVRRSDWSPPFGDPFRDAIRALDDVGNGEVELGIDIGCAVEHGGFVVERGSDQRATDIEVSEPNVSLIYFVMRLLRKLQAIASAPAIDYDAYLRCVPGMP